MSGTMVVTIAATDAEVPVGVVGAGDLREDHRQRQRRVRRKSSGISSEFQQNRNCRMPTAKIGVSMLGSTTWKNVVIGPQPSMRAASISSFGKSSRKFFTRKIDQAKLRPT